MVPHRVAKTRDQERGKEMSAIIRNAITFTGRFREHRFFPAADGKRAMLSVTIYDRDGWTDNQGGRHDGDWENVNITYWGRIAEQLNAVIESGIIPEKSCIMGTGHIAASPRTWIDKDGKAHGNIQIEGQTLNPDIIRESNRQQAAGRDQQQQARDTQHTPAEQDGEPAGWGTNQAPTGPTGAPAPGAQAPGWAEGGTR